MLKMFSLNWNFEWNVKIYQKINTKVSYFYSESFIFRYYFATKIGVAEKYRDFPKIEQNFMFHY